MSDDDAAANPETLAIADAAPGDTLDDLTNPQETPAPGGGEPEPDSDFEAEAELTVEVIAKVISAKWPVVVYDDPTKKAARDVFAPVIKKYQLIPPWLVAWQEEVQLGIFLAVTGFTTWQLIQAAKPPEENGEESEAQET